ncbi:hypothetical protein EV178_002082 [Coemansia sp. RSA 1646]|nr:hypothetical protein EV178_002082 [Coemansia sp. RSA 1646]KAJ2216133.1 hypothetical protein EV179_001593 [Coemansia sp. RSA 487]
MLESLDIVNLPCKNLRKLFYDDNDQPITYPKLRKLDYHLVSFVKAEDMLSLDESIVPFPALTHLNWPTTYTFADDTLFRGNSDALEYLNVVFDTNLIDILERYSVFSGGKYSKLRHITASKSYSIHTAQMSFESFARFAISLISPATRSFKMIDHSPCQPLFDTISTNAFAENIQILNLGATKLVLLDMLDLIKLLPNITDFTCLPGGIGSDLGKKRGKSMLDLHADYYPLSHRLKCWVIPYTNSIPVRSIALASISLAILCTNFTFTALPHSKRKVYHSELTKALAIEEYSKYAEKIQLLFYRE